MIATYLPSVLFHPRGSISMERALKQIKKLLEQCPSINESMEDEIQVSIDDIESMLDAIKH